MSTGGMILLENMLIEKYGHALVASITSYLRTCVRSAVAQRRGIKDGDVGIVLMMDFAAMGTLKEMYLKQCILCHSGLLSTGFDSVTVGFYPEKSRGHSQFVLSPREKKHAAVEGEIADDSDADMLVDEGATLPVVEASVAERKTYQQLRANLARDRADIDSAFCRCDLTRWYPEPFSLVFEECGERSRLVQLPLLAVRRLVPRLQS